MKNFLGPDRTIKRLSLIDVASMMTKPRAAPKGTPIAPDANLHVALASILDNNLQGLDVTAPDGTVIGYLDRDAILACHAR